jgi:hypothetical protein
MERKVKISIFSSISAIAIVLALWGASWASISVSVVGVWSESVDETDLAGGPGSDLVGTYESSADQVSADISGTTGDLDTWRVDVKESDNTWHGNLHLYLKRTSDGTGSGSISGGGSYMEVSDTYVEFFGGGGDRTGIHLQLKIMGVSVGVPAEAYSTTVSYTVVDTN